MLWAYNALLHFIGDCGRLQEALAVYEQMRISGVCV
jgi:pentatricopeptide repeat protein